LPTFKADGDQDPAEFLELWKRHMVAYEVEEAKYLSIFPLALGTDENHWLDRWLGSQWDVVSWSAVEVAFLARYQHPHRLAAYRKQFHSLRMEHGHVKAYIDKFLFLMGKLRLQRTDELVVHQFKSGMSEKLCKQVMAAITPYTILAGGVEPSVQQLADIAVGLEADTKLASSFPQTSSHPTSSKTKPTSGKKCTHCGRLRHTVDVCRTLAAEKKKTVDSTVPPSPAKMGGTSKPPVKPSSLSDAAKAERMAKIICHKYKKPGHYASTCTEQTR
jgi:hypothetical protein